ncbi:MAG: hypothetical protein AABW73_04085 [Nanoarchaeota archaeon]
MIKTNKKGFELLGGKTVGIIIGLLCLIVLLTLGAKIAGVRSQAETKERAQGMMNEIVSIMEKLNEGQSQEYFITAVHEWYLVRNFDVYPRSCNGDYECFCLCPDESYESCFSYDICKAPYYITLKKLPSDSGSARTLELHSPVKGSDELKQSLVITKNSDGYLITYKPLLQKVST